MSFRTRFGEMVMPATGITTVLGPEIKNDNPAVPKVTNTAKKEAFPDADDETRLAEEFTARQIERALSGGDAFVEPTYGPKGQKPSNQRSIVQGLRINIFQ